MGTTTIPATGRAVWRLDPAHTLVEFSARHLMVATVKGRFTSVGGTVTLDPERPAEGSVAVEIDAASLTTGDDRRDGHLRSADFLDVEQYPTITFTSTTVEPAGGDRFKVHGDLTIRGVTRPVVLDAVYNGQTTNPWGKQIVGVSAETTINRTDWGANWNVALEAGGVLVGEQVRITIEAEAIREG